MSLSRVWTSVTLALLLGVSILLIGCASSGITLHPIEKSDIFSMETGKSYSSEKNGWFLSDDYFKEVLKAKISK